MRIGNIILILHFIFTGSCYQNEPANQPDLPNIIFILADDLGYGDIGFLNKDSKIPTPRINRLAGEGIIFADAHSPSSVCTPTRYGILTGRYCFRSRLKEGVLYGYDSSLIEPGRLTVASILKNAGYRTGCIGKWHLGLNFKRKDANLPLVQNLNNGMINTGNIDYTDPVGGGPDNHGFEYSFILPSSLDIPPYFFIRNGQIVNPDISYLEGSSETGFQGKFWRAGDASKDFDFYNTLPILTREALEFIENKNGPDASQPFFLYFPLTAPHTPWVPLDEFTGRSDAGNYGDFVTQVDGVVGQLLDKLDELKLTQNTLVIFTSDNGAYWLPGNILHYNHHANYLFRGMKSDVWEGGHHVPFIARWPVRIKAGSVSDRLVSLTDLMATCAEITLSELTGNSAEDSYSFLDVLTGIKNTNEHRTHMIMHSVSGVFAIREENWKLIEGRGSGGWSYAGSSDEPIGQLYDLSTDITEHNNLYVKHPDVVSRLQSLLDKQRQEPATRGKAEKNKSISLTGK